jgi:hypothetical protein
MWSSVLVVAFLTALDPIRFGFIILLISRPRPVQDLFAYWIGCMLTSGFYLVVPLMVLHFTRRFTSLSHDLATPATAASSTVRHIQFGVGVLALSIAVVMTMRSSARQRAQLSRTGSTSTLVLDSNKPIASPSLGHAQDVATPQDESAIRRLPSRLRNAWENGSSWVAFAIGLISGPPPSPFLFALTTIATSGAAIATQVSVAIAFVVGMLAVVEIILISYLAIPAKTQAVLRLVHDWVQPRRRQILVAIFAIVGAMLVAKGMGVF